MASWRTRPGKLSASERQSEAMAANAVFDAARSALATGSGSFAADARTIGGRAGLLELSAFNAAAAGLGGVFVVAASGATVALLPV